MSANTTASDLESGQVGAAELAGQFVNFIPSVTMRREPHVFFMPYL